MATVIFYDNCFDVPNDVKNLLSFDSYADLIVAKKSLRARLELICESRNLGILIAVDKTQSAQLLAQELHKSRKAGLRIIYLPSYLALAASEEAAGLFLEKLSLAETNIRVDVDKVSASSLSLPPIVLVGDDANKFYDAALEGNHREELQGNLDNFEVIPDDIGIRDLRDPAQFLSVITSTFDVRHFNSLASEDRFTVIKGSTDTRKLYREYAYYGLLPAELQRYFVQPYGFVDQGKTASYKMERLLVPDAALQWVHGSLTGPHFAQFMQRLFHFVQSRPPIELSQNVKTGHYSDLFVEKVRRRIEELENMPAFPIIDANARLAFGGVRKLLDRYCELHASLTRKIHDNQLVISHGDLCFSNILYGKSTGILKLIDPRGAEKLDELYMPSYYDIAKLSHSVEGKYDFINAGLFAIELDPQNAPRLRINAPQLNNEIGLFRRYCSSAGFAPRIVRLYEASLFISMTPLHIDAPRKVLAFLLNANDILNIVESESNWN